MGASVERGHVQPPQIAVLARMVGVRWRCGAGLRSLPGPIARSRASEHDVATATIPMLTSSVCTAETVPNASDGNPGQLARVFFLFGRRLDPP